jgi:hypothetical protein
MKIPMIMMLLALLGGRGWTQSGASRADAEQVRVPGGTRGEVYVDAHGVMRWTKTHAEAAFFGVNYTVPFAYSYRAHQAAHADPEEAIREDVYHMARLGLDAFRVHVWDTEISDSLGNLLENEHLRLFDFLVAELRKRGIRVIITPIAFWGNGYPQKDEMTPGFSRVYGKGKATVDEAAIRAEENYLHQLFRHVNPYTKLTYGADPDVIAAELDNEPSHSGPAEGVTRYINRLAAAVRATGWSKPLFYNISQNPFYAAAVAASDVNGFSFQWYPTGLVYGQERRGNYLPNVDSYPVPFDSIAAFRDKARMVYEFDAADVLASYMYPAMVRSFRASGFQWATQFAYDPLALAYANTEYQTHYLNLAYTPSKAISLLIAARAFHRIPRGKTFGAYPVDSVFDVFRVSYRESLSEMNSGPEFYYSNPTDSKPVNAAGLEHVAGVGSSTVVHYGGTGAYFLDKVGAGLWRLEVMPDAVSIRNPFGKPAPDREVTRIEWREHAIDISLSDLGEGFSIKGLNVENHYTGVAMGGHFSLSPGTYLLSSRASGGREPVGDKVGELGMNEFVAPTPYSREPYVRHTPYNEVSSGRSFTIRSIIVGLDSGDKAMVQISRVGGYGPGRMIPMTREGGDGDTRGDGNAGGDVYTAEAPADIVMPGLLQYRIILERPDSGGRPGERDLVYPGGHPGNPFAWDYYDGDTGPTEWQTFVAAPHAGLDIFNATTDRDATVYPAFRRGFAAEWISGPDPERLLLKMGWHASSGTRQGAAAEHEPAGDKVFGVESFVGDKIRGRETEEFGRVVIRGRGVGAGGTTGNGGSAGGSGSGGSVGRLKITLIDGNGEVWSAFIELPDSLGDVGVPFSQLAPSDGFLLLPRPYPGFLPLRFKYSGAQGPFSWKDTEKIQITMEDGGGFEIESVEFRP